MNSAKVSVILKSKDYTDKFVNSFCDFAIKHDLVAVKSDSEWEFDLIKTDADGSDTHISNFDVLRIIEWSDNQNYVLSCVCRLNN